MRVTENYQIPGHTGQIIDAFVERYESDDGLLNSDFIVEPSQNFKENLPLVIAPCLVDINYAPTVKFRIMNPFPTNASIKAETIIGTAEILTNHHKTSKHVRMSMKRVIQARLEGFNFPILRTIN